MLKQQPMLKKVEEAKRLLYEVECQVECPWCRSHIRLVREAMGDLEVLAATSFAMQHNPHLLKALRLLGARAETLKAFALMARLILRLHGIKL